MKRNRFDTNGRRRQAALQWRGIKAHRLRLNEELIHDFCELVREGVAPETVADKLRLGRRTYQNWLGRGQQFEENYGEPEEDMIYAAFTQEFREARPVFRGRHLLGLTRVTASEQGFPDAGWDRARQLLSA